METASEMGAITHPSAGVPVSDLDAGNERYTRFFAIATYSNGVRSDPDGNALAFAEPSGA
jgi:hypothetical protein